MQYFIRIRLIVHPPRLQRHTLSCTILADSEVISCSELSINVSLPKNYDEKRPNIQTNKWRNKQTNSLTLITWDVQKSNPKPEGTNRRTSEQTDGRADQSVTFVNILTRTNVRIYSYQNFDTNKYPNKYLDRTYLNIRIYSSLSGLD